MNIVAIDPGVTDFLKIVEYLKATKPTLELYIVTNGSYKTTSWWQDLKMILKKG